MGHTEKLVKVLEHNFDFQASVVITVIVAMVELGNVAWHS